MPEIPPVTTLAEEHVGTLSGTPLLGGYQLQGDGTESVALAAQSDAKQRGVYSVPLGGGPWVRRSDFNSAANMLPLTRFDVLQGDHALQTWWLTNRTAPDPATDSVYLEIYRRAPIEAGTGLERVGAVIRDAETGVTAGDYANITALRVTAGGRIGAIAGGSPAIGYIDGLRLRYVDATTVALDPGACYVPGLNRYVSIGAAQTQTRLTGNDAVYHAYVREVNGVGNFFLSATEPAAPYFGSARTLDGDTSTRWQGMLRNDGGGNLLITSRTVLGGSVVLVRYVGATSGGWATMRALQGVTDTSAEPVDLGPAGAKLVSPGTEAAYVDVAATTSFYFSPLAAFATASAGRAMASPDIVALNPDQTGYYSLGGVGSADLFVLGYFERR